MWYLYTVEFYSVMKKNEILSFANDELENIVLSEVSQTQNRMFSSYADFTSRANAVVLLD
jgi:hypothetical protein